MSKYVKKNEITNENGGFNMNTKRMNANEYKASRFYKMPKWLIHDEHFKGLSNDAKILYMIMRDRYELSMKNNWIDKNGDIYMIYSRESMCEDLGVSMKPVIKSVKELVKYNLIEEVRQGCNKPNLLYVLTITVDGQWTCRNDISKYGDIPYPNMEICHPNDTYISDTDLNDTKINYSSYESTESQKVEYGKEIKTQEEERASFILSLLPNIRLTKKHKQILNSYDMDKVMAIIDKHSSKIKSFEYIISCYETPVEIGSEVEEEKGCYVEVEDALTGEIKKVWREPQNKPTGDLGGKVINGKGKGEKPLESKNKAFTSMYSHNHDLEELEMLAMNYTIDEVMAYREEKNK